MNRRITRGMLAVAGAAALLTGTVACSQQVATAEAGECTNFDELQGEITEIPTVDCTEEHDAQFVHVFDLDDGDYPGDDAVETAAQEGCTTGFEEFVGTPYAESTLNVMYIPPNQDTWEQADDRQVLCVAYLDGSTTTESFEGSGL